MIENTLSSLKILGLYILPCVLVLLFLRFLYRPEQYVFRKLLHMVAFSCVTVMIYLSLDPYAAALACVLVTVILYPLLSFLERYAWFQNLLVEKRAGEIKSSFVQLLLTAASVILVSWGLLDRKDTAIAAVQMWGFGDEMAALIGIPYGRHPLKGRFTDSRKTVEGSLAMFISSFLVGVLLFCVIGKRSFYLSVILSLGAAFFGTVAEAVSKNGYDTVSVPLCMMSVLLLAETVLDL